MGASPREFEPRRHHILGHFIRGTNPTYDGKDDACLMMLFVVRILCYRIFLVKQRESTFHKLFVYSVYLFLVYNMKDSELPRYMIQPDFQYSDVRMNYEFSTVLQWPEQDLRPRVSFTRTVRVV